MPLLRQAVPSTLVNKTLAAGFRPDTGQLIKAGYMVKRERGAGALDRIFGVQLVTMLHPLSMGWH